MTRLEKIAVSVMADVFKKTELISAKDRTALILVSEYGMEISAADVLSQKVYENYLEAYS